MSLVLLVGAPILLTAAWLADRAVAPHRARLRAMDPDAQVPGVQVPGV